MTVDHSAPLAERVSLLAGSDTWHTPAAAGVPVIRMSDGPAGVRGTSWRGPASASFPCGTALGATFDPELIGEVGRALGREARSKSSHVLLAPTVNLHRTPIGGRNFECMSEDPFLTAEIAEAYVTGVQGEGVACCIKHFVGNDTEFQRMTISAEIDERTLRELYLLPFERAVAAGVRSIMTAYNRLGGTFCADHEWLLRTVLRGEWGFDGVVVSDWFGLHSTVEAMRAGLDIEMPGPTLHRGDALVVAVESGEVDEHLVDEAIDRIAALADWTGAGSDDGSETTLDDPVTWEVQRRAAVAGTVLLTNHEAQLPWDGSAGRVAVIGPYAQVGRPQGGGSARVTPGRFAPIVETLTARGVEVEHVPGCSIERYHPPIRGEVELVVTDEHGETASSTLTATVAFWQEEPAPGLSRSFAASMLTTFTPEVDGVWTVGARSVGACTVSVDGEAILEISADDRGGSFFDYGSPERVAEVRLEAGREVALTIDYPIDEHPGIRALAVGLRPPPGDDPVAEAVAVASRADRVLLVVGTDDDWETESMDRDSIALPGRQDELVSAVAAVNPNTVVVVNAGSPVSMPWADDVAAVMQVWFPGAAIGDALADVVLGDDEPGGRLPVTFPGSLEETPAFEHYPGSDGRAVYGEGRLLGHRWFSATGRKPLFWFGHGLSYTSFSVECVSVSGDPVAGVEVSVRVANTGDRVGSEVVQIYACHEPVDGGLAGDGLRLVGFQKVRLEPGSERLLSITLEPRRFASWSDGWLVPAGEHVISVGRSSADRVESARLRVVADSNVE
jgi:beta-glucosidase